MTRSEPPFVSHCVELLAPLGAVRVRRMFGGWGLYVDDLFVAIIAFERLYLKADAASRAAFEAAGCEPFVYDVKGQAVSLGYWTAPAEALEAPTLMAPWARRAMQAALAARASRTARPGLHQRRRVQRLRRRRPVAQRHRLSLGAVDEGLAARLFEGGSAGGVDLQVQAFEGDDGDE